MSDTVMMACGCAAQAVSDGKPICAIHLNREVVETPDLTGRIARCGCGREEPSGTGLAFFEYQGPGSAFAQELCRCGYHAVAHGKVNKMTGREGITDHPFEARGPAEFDRFYCGCRGWD